MLIYHVSSWVVAGLHLHGVHPLQEVLPEPAAGLDPMQPWQVYPKRPFDQLPRPQTLDRTASAIGCIVFCPMRRKAI